MPGIPERVSELESKVEQLCICMCEVHRTIDAQIKIMREHGEYSNADLCDICHGKLQVDE